MLDIISVLWLVISIMFGPLDIEYPQTTFELFLDYCNLNLFCEYHSSSYLLPQCRCLHVIQSASSSMLHIGRSSVE